MKTYTDWVKNNIQLKKTEMLLTECHFVLNQIPNSAKIESYFTEYVLIVFHREFEEKFKQILHEALEQYAGNKAVEFIKRIKDPLFKRISIEDIKKTIGYFGPEKKEYFKSSLKKIDRNKNFIENRHSVAHASGSISISWREIQEIDKIGIKILKEIYISLIKH